MKRREDLLDILAACIAFHRKGGHESHSLHLVSSILGLALLSDLARIKVWWVILGQDFALRHSDRTPVLGGDGRVECDYAVRSCGCEAGWLRQERCKAGEVLQRGVQPWAKVEGGWWWDGRWNVGDGGSTDASRE